MKGSPTSPKIPIPAWSLIAFVLAFGLMLSGWITQASAAGPVGWVVECGFVKHLTADPIAYPKQPNAGHLHDFFGNISTDAFSTYTSLRAAGTNCAIPEDGAAYWVPALYSNAQLLVPHPLTSTSGTSSPTEALSARSRRA